MNSPHSSSASANTIRPLLLPTISSNYQRNAYYDLPLKIVVNSKYIGAIIGLGGCNIREIIKNSKARCLVDVNNPTYDDVGNLEKVIWITGLLENCSNACYRIMQVIQNEIENDKATSSNVELKIRVPNQLIGRFIGKGGISVKKIMEDTNTTILISDSRGAFDMYSIYQDPAALERIITIHANSIEAVAHAESIISQKLRNFYEADLNAGLVFSPNTINLNSLMNVPPIAIGSPNQRDGLINGFNVQNTANNGSPACFFYSPINIPFNTYTPNVNMTLSHNPIQLKSHVYVPSSVVGALIGTKGFHIRNMMSLTGANIHIDSSSDTGKKLKKETNVGDNSVGASNENNDSLKNANENTTQNANDVNTELNSNEQKNLLNTNSTEKQQNNANENNSAETCNYLTNTNENTQKKESISTNGNTATTFYERCVTISGFDFQVYKAEFWVFQRIAEYMHQFLDDLVLTTETFVPSKIIGRIIGKNGRNVRELQRITQATVKIPDDLNNQNETNNETPVCVIGNYYSLQAVQCRFGMLITDTEQRENTEQKRSQLSKNTNVSNSNTTENTLSDNASNLEKDENFNIKKDLSSENVNKLNAEIINNNEKQKNCI